MFDADNSASLRVAVVGPTRMDYPGTMATVRAVAQYVGEILAGRAGTIITADGTYP